jgi:hypothetical protein
MICSDRLYLDTKYFYFRAHREHVTFSSVVKICTEKPFGISCMHVDHLLLISVL